jgi:hypothetical protein
MLIGAAFLIAGCWKGLAAPQARTLVLCLLSVGIAMFAASLVLLRKRPASHMVESTTPTNANLKPLAAPAAKPMDAVIAKPQPLPRESVATEPRLALEFGSMQTMPTESSPVEGALDVMALMDAPLADLLLAALCKDPVGARRIFARALESGAPPVTQVTPSTSGVSVPSAPLVAPPERVVHALAIGATTTVAP